MTYEKIRKNFLFITMLVVFVLIFLLNKNTILMADDYNYSFIFNTDTRVNNVMDIFKSQYLHYMTWGGRSVVHFIAQTFLLCDKVIFNIVNSIIYIVLSLLICKHAVGSKKIKFTIFVAVSLMLWVFTPVFGQTVLWLIGSCNYLWGTVLALMFLLPFRLLLDENSNIKVNPILIFIIGVLGGWTNENTAGAIILLALIITFITKKRKNRVPKWCYVGIVSAIIGFIMMIASPGNYIRAKDPVFQYQGSIIGKYLHRLVNICKDVYGEFVAIGLILVILLILVKNIKQNNKIKISLIYVFGAVSAIGAGILAPYIPVRAYFGAMILVYIAVATLLDDLLSLENNKITKKLIYVALGYIFIFIFIPSYFKAYKDISRTYNEATSKNTYIITERNKGNLDLNVKQIESYNKYNGFYGGPDMSEKADFWINIQVAKYYKINSIKATIK